MRVASGERSGRVHANRDPFGRAVVLGVAGRPLGSFSSVQHVEPDMRLISLSRDRVIQGEPPDLFCGRWTFELDQALRRHFCGRRR